MPAQHEVPAPRNPLTLSKTRSLRHFRLDHPDLCEGTVRAVFFATPLPGWGAPRGLPAPLAGLVFVAFSMGNLRS